MLLFDDTVRQWKELPLTVKGLVRAEHSSALKYLSPSMETKFMLLDMNNGSIYRNAFAPAAVRVQVQGCLQLDDVLFADPSPCTWPHLVLRRTLRCPFPLEVWRQSRCA